MIFKNGLEEWSFALLELPSDMQVVGDVSVFSLG
jgi:hypothetical protein